ncbi:MAG: hypothetical protein GXO73_10470 [Calditrichaeota bacterium]|nr:hypothetical protein [Calditrichota bacterium]
MRRFILTFLFLAFLPLVATVGAQEDAPSQASSTCVQCHAALDGALAQPAKAFADDVHARHGYTCADCHGGDPSAEDPAVAMSPAKGFIGVPNPAEVPKLCGRCHANVALMRAEKPGLRTDQLELYWTSRHGMLLKKGDTNVAVCSSCHRAHGVLPPSDPRSSVHPTRVAATCGACHSNKTLMARYGLPTDQEAEWRSSVHAEVMLKQNDLSAPTCNDCHGNHGALPPQVSSISRVCGQCHVANDEYFQESPHRKAFAEMGLGQCEVCHGNHAVARSSDEMLGVEDDAVCASCHAEGDAGFRAALRMRQAIDSLRTGIEATEALLSRVEKAGIPVDEADFVLREARNSLVQSRTEVHKFAVEPVLNVVEAGFKKLAEAQRFGRSALHEIRKRRVGLLAFLAVSLVVVIGLVLTIRSSER